MTDITELAQSLKAAAERATPGNWRYIKTTPFMDAEISAANHTRVVNLMAGDVTEENSTFIALANPANVLALVEALEKAQRANAAQDDHINQQQDRIEQLEKRNAYLGKHVGMLEKRLKGTEESLIASTDMVAELESRTVTAAAADVLAERKRQVSVEGWTPSHDDTHKNNEMAFAAACYAFHAAAASWDLEDCGTEYDSHPAPKNWPWEPEWWKPKSARADLVRAGALILAELERIDRAAGIKVEAE
ncbi:ead/Ea22-like family protein [Raoultella ornithinolytica]|uniref:ead/Ea22-like family protein n=1 Tax=Raoultella ornithinolytica TaxID=54291 RepID=UPI00389031CC